MNEPQPTGQAYSRDEHFIYTWYTDGSVTRHVVFRRRSPIAGTIGYVSHLGTEESVNPPIKYNDRDFLAFVGVVAKTNAG